jgi:hypothetical protein
MRHPLDRHRPQFDQLLAGGDLALDNPIERTAIQQFLGALGHLAGDVHQLRLLALGLLLLQPLLLPGGEIGKAVAADTEFNEMEHEAEFSAARYRR